MRFMEWDRIWREPNPHCDLPAHYFTSAALWDEHRRCVARGIISTAPLPPAWHWLQVVFRNESTPRSLRKLIEYLGRRPFVIDKRTNERWGFVCCSESGLWFEDAWTESRYIPLNCGKVDAETGVTFDDAGFTVTKFGRSLRFEYAVEAPALAGRG